MYYYNSLDSQFPFWNFMNAQISLFYGIEYHTCDFTLEQKLSPPSNQKTDADIFYIGR